MAEIDRTPAPGSANLQTQLPGQSTTVDGLALASGDVGAGNLMEVDIDQELFQFESDDTPLMQLMLAAKKISVNSPIVQHYQVDEERTTVTVTQAVPASTQMQTVLPVGAADIGLCQPCTTLRVRGVNGYDPTGRSEMPGVSLMLYVIGFDATTNNPIVRAVNGPRANTSDEFCTMPDIPAGTVIDILGNALHETQRTVPPDSVMPVPETIYLQKRGMNRVVSDYFESQKKRIPFANAILAEHAIRKFKRAGNRTLWASLQGKFNLNDPVTGVQTAYTTKGVLWQFKRCISHIGDWSYREFIGLAKLFFTGVDVPQGAICLCGKNFLENIQCIDFSKHPEVKIEVKTNKLGWSVTSIHTVFGDFDFKHEPTLDSLGLSNSAGIFGMNRLVHYQRTAEHSEKERIEGHEANRESTIVWDALALKGSCHIWIDGEGTRQYSIEAYKLWTSDEAPTNFIAGDIYYLTCDCPGMHHTARAGTLWQVTTSLDDELHTVVSWNEYRGEILPD